MTPDSHMDPGTALVTPRLRNWLQDSLPRLGAIFWCAFLVRVLAIWIGHTYRFKAEDGNFGFGWETGRIAASIAGGNGFGNPFHGITGPSAWIAPVYPYLLAAIFKVFGIYTRPSAFVVLTINSLLSALTIFPVYHAGRRLFSQKIALASAWAWALLPYVWYWDVRWPWETSLSALLLATALMLSLQLGDCTTTLRWGLFGLVWATIALTNPALCSLIPFYGCFAVWKLHRAKAPWFRGAVTSGLIFLALIAPWTVRNYKVFHHIFFIRGNFGVELSLGNAVGANGLWMSYKHPSADPAEFQRYSQVGEYQYAQERKHVALVFIRENPPRFLRLVLTRAVYYWWDTPRATNHPAEEVARHMLYFGSSILAWWGLARMVRQKRTGSFLIAATLGVYPFVYYLTFAHPRYRHPIEPVMLMLAIFLISETGSIQKSL